MTKAEIITIVVFYVSLIISSFYSLHLSKKIKKTYARIIENKELELDYQRQVISKQKTLIRKQHNLIEKHKELNSLHEGVGDNDGTTIL